ncbi:MAG: tRNA (N(6)-L-threonylcarbamoyladenosine(37)-C(2))-methylthiotransferase MtaB [Alphaproteobacteria bacterium]|nr:tRNA (N(6)-L-threonylcarbamoyladenosine(37)-C(2))-methylthiotransferase MtaB [Alphaproteobacteria bacterium]
MPEEPALITLGCRLNIYESEVMRRHLAQAELRDIVVINSCAVTGQAEKQTRQAIRKARRARPSACVVVTGCAAQIHPQAYAAMPEVDHVLGNDVKMDLATWQNLRERRVHISALAQEALPPMPLVQGFEGMTRAFVQVQNGCDHRCSFCLVPKGRGASRSVPLESLIAQGALLCDQGYPEITLTGVDICAYGKDLSGSPTLGGMIRALLKAVPSLKRLRLSSLNPAAIDEDLWALAGEELRLMPHWHLSVQSGDDKILRRMARRHKRDDVIKLCQRARALRPDMVFGADLIAGFAGETDQMHAQTMALVKEAGLTWLHVFPFSARAGTAAARMGGQVENAVRKARAQDLRNLSTRAVKLHLEQLIGQELAVHVEQPYLGRAPSFAEVLFDSPQKVGDVVQARGYERKGIQMKATVL